MRLHRLIRSSFDLMSALVVAIVLVTIAIGALSSISSCTHPGPTLLKWSNQFVGCEKEDLGQLVQSGEIQATLLDDVAAVIQGNADSLESDLAKLAGEVGIEGVHCAIMAVQSSLAPNVGTLATRAKPQGLVRAKAWLAAQESKGSGSAVAK